MDVLLNSLRKGACLLLHQYFTDCFMRCNKFAKEIGIEGKYMMI